MPIALILILILVPIESLSVSHAWHPHPHLHFFLFVFGGGSTLPQLCLQAKPGRNVTSTGLVLQALSEVCGHVQGPRLIGVDALHVLSVGDVVLGVPIGEDNAKRGHVPAALPLTQDATPRDSQLADYFWCAHTFFFCMRSPDGDGHVQVNRIVHLNGEDECKHLEWFDHMPSSITSLTHASFSSCRSATCCHSLSSVAPCQLQTSPHVLQVPRTMLPLVYDKTDASFMEPLPMDPVYNCTVCLCCKEEEIRAHPHIVHCALAALHVLLCTE